MVTGLDLHATLHRIVIDAVDTVPSAQRGCLLVWDGEQLVYKASVGLAGVLASPQEVVGGAGPATVIAALSRHDSADSARVTAAGDWYREHLPGASALHLVAAGAVVVLTPVRVQEQTIGVLAVEQPDGQAPSGERWARLLALAASAGAARWSGESWIRSRCCAGSPPASRRRAFTPSSTRACSPRQVHGASASDRALRSHKSLRRRTKTPLRNASVAAIGRSTNRAELLRRTFAIDVLECPACKGRMKRVAMVTEPRNIARFLSALGEPTDVPARSPNRGPPYWKSTVLRRKAPGDAA
ncbi:hypothetical protein WMF04_33025 [Sorangium sp. So ce260]|uniref:hypothetical protein n=1 Tax=Sorangium sp. So ce260 TaxID=3133291 RepID=UPI003F63581D